MTPTVQPGVCRHCGVRDEQIDGDKRYWFNLDRTCCSSWACVRKEQDRLKRKAARPVSEFKGWGLGAIAIEKRRRARMRRKGMR